MSTSPNLGWPAFARSVIAARLVGGDPDCIPPPTTEPIPHGGAFVTLRRFRRLRGCVGTLDAGLAVAEAVRDAALSSAFNDTRFQPLTQPELPDVRIEVSILSHPAPMRNLSELVLGTHGIIVRQGGCRGLFLPKVATDHGLSKEAFLERCCTEKARLAADAWKQPGTEVLLFTTETFAEPD